MEPAPAMTPSGARVWRQLTGVPAESVHPGSQLGRLLDWCATQSATDVHGAVGRPFTIRRLGELERVPGEIALPLTDDDFFQLLRETFSPSACQRIEAEHEVDLGFHHRDLRYRANFSKQMGRQAFAFRTVPQQRMKLGDLQLPATLLDLASAPRGLVLVTGPTGQGKSTTARALLQEINEQRAVRVITVEDPVEYVFTDGRARFEQREVGIDTASFADGIRNAMRQDPNVIFVGEIRDRESTYAALQAAETGHLVITTLHADSVAQAIGRMLEFYPAAEHPNLASLLGRNLNAVLGQRLIPNVSGTRTPCLEVLRRNAGVSEAIRTLNLELLGGILEAAVEEGMHSFDQYLVELLAAGIVARETAMTYAVNRHRLEMRLRGFETVNPILRPDAGR